MKIKTDVCLVEDRQKINLKIAKFWDQISEGWQQVWGPHIHHGYYENEAPLSKEVAQEILIDKLADLVKITSQHKILDVGCGLGGSSLYLAKKFGAKITGITLSEKQWQIATRRAEAENIKDVHFKIEDALSLNSFSDQTIDLVWSLESCEQFYDKTLFIEQAYRMLKPGGTLMIATWCSSQDEYDGIFAEKYKLLCDAFDLPYMPTIEYYQSILKAQHFILDETLDWSTQVKKSWEVGISLVNAYSLWKIFKMTGWRGLRFSKQINLMHQAFSENRIKYGAFIAKK